MIDITRTIDELKKDEERQLKIEELEDLNEILKPQNFVKYKKEKILEE